MTSDDRHRKPVGTISPSTGSSTYRGAVAHYLSPDRRDAVKRRWEEPVNHRVVAAALDRLRPGPDPLRVVDIGAGTGDGVALLEGSIARSGDPGRRFSYVGIDPDPDMITTARATHGDRPDVAFVLGDVREPLPVADVDLYLSSGVPWSHLRHDEFLDALTGVLAATARAPHPAAIVVDVLGRYSIEWTPRWASDQWDYDMSFFAGADRDAPITAPMSFHDRLSLERAIATARRRTGTALARTDFVDRSIMVGRHTATGAFNPGLPPYRTMINALHDGDRDVDLGALALRAPDGAAPDAVTAFFADLATRWNARVDRTRADEARTGPSAGGRRQLADDLRACEHAHAPGLGVGHSLIALLVTGPS